MPNVATVGLSPLYDGSPDALGVRLERRNEFWGIVSARDDLVCNLTLALHWSGGKRVNHAFDGYAPSEDANSGMCGTPRRSWGCQRSGP